MNISHQDRFIGHNGNKYSDRPAVNRKQQQIKELQDDIAQYLAKGGKVEVLPGFTGISPKTPTVSFPTPEDAPDQWRQADGYPGFLIHQDGARMWNRAKAAFLAPSNSRGVVYVKKLGKTVAVKPAELARIAWSEES